MARHKEPLSGGLWTAADPGVLEPGQLTDARNCLYLAGSNALQRSSGRDVFGVVSATATNVVGLRDAQFDNSDHYLFALASTSVLTATVGDTGTFGTYTTIPTTGTSLEAAHFRNRYYMFSGATVEASAASANGNFVAYASATAVGSVLQKRVHGLLPVVSAPFATTGVGTFSQTVTGYYDYWTTEVIHYQQDGVDQFIESSFATETGPTTVFISATGIRPTLTMPAPRNPGTTHWRLYRSTKKELAADKIFPTGFMVGEVAVATATQIDGVSSSTTSYAFPTTYNTTGPYAEATNPSNLGADDGTYATMAVGTTVGVGLQQAAYGFSFSGIAGNVIGIEVEVQGYLSAGGGGQGVGLEAKIGTRRSDGHFAFASSGTGIPPVAKAGRITSTSVGAPDTLLFGSQTDRWVAQNVAGFTATNFDTNFMVVLRAISLGTSATVSLDYVRVRITYGDATIQGSTIPFPTVVYSFGDISAQVGKNGPPPSSDTGDVYEDSLVVNDLSNRSLVRYSFAGEPDAFPETYYIDFETRENDRVRAIKVVNDNLVVWLDSSTWRINYLPSERDASFDRGKAKKPVSSSYGCIDSMCMAVFSPGGGVDLAAFVSHHGIHATDGYSFETYTEGLDWSNITGDGAGTPIALINDRSRSLLLYFFRNDNDYGSETYMCLAMSYGEGHWNGKPKVCGLWHMRNHSGGLFASLESAWPVQRSTGVVSVYLGYGGSSTDAGAGKVYRETGTAIPALDPRMQYVTREMYLADHGNEWEMGELYGYAHGYGATTPTVSYVLQTRKTNDTGLSTRGTKTLTLGGQKMHRVGFFHDNCEAARVTFAATASAFAEEFLVIDGTNFGLEDSGR